MMIPNEYTSILLSYSVRSMLPPDFMSSGAMYKSVPTMLVIVAEPRTSSLDSSTFLSSSSSVLSDVEFAVNRERPKSATLA